MEYTYIIKPKTDITQAMLDVCVQKKVSDLRTSLDGTLAVLKWETQDDDPSMFDGDTKYTNAEMLVEMAKLAWNPPEPT